MEEAHSITRQWIIVAVGAVVLIALGWGAYSWYAHREPAPAAAAPAAAAHSAAAPPPAAAARPAPAAGPRYPIDESASDHDTPLERSDKPLLESLTHVQGWRASALHLIVPEQLIRHIVATVDALARDKLPLAVLPTRPVPGTFRTTGAGDKISIAAANARRYEPFVGLVASLDSAQLAATYRRFYPLFQQAYKELGYPTGYFNDRLVEVIDELLEAPAPAQPVAVQAPGAMFHFVDPDLEGLSSGQKILVRVGPANEDALKKKLRELRAAVTATAQP